MSRPEGAPGRPALWGITFLLAACSVLYELVLAQSLAATLGDTFLRYNVTISLYLASLGLGSLLCRRRPGEDLVLRLCDVELALSTLGALAPLMVHYWDVFVFRAHHGAGFAFRGPLYQALIHGFNHALIVGIGVLSGFELPLLMWMAPGEKGSNEVLAVDYFGTLAGAVLFPLALLPQLGVITTATSTALVNAFCGAALLLRRPRRAGRTRWAGYAAAGALIFALLARREEVHRAVTESFHLF